MKRIKTIYNTATNFALVCTIFFLSIVILTSCKKDFLNRLALDRIQESNVWNDAGLIETYVNSAYRSVPQGHEFIFGRTLSCLTDECNRKTNANYDMITAGNVTSTTLGILDFWQGIVNPAGAITAPGHYNTISITNVFFENIESSPIDTAMKKRMIGEMKVLRAFSYFRLIGFFGGVPLITKSFSLRDNFDLPRNTYDECMAFVIKETDEAIALLPLTYPAASMGRVTKGAAMALKSRALLYAASPLNNIANDKTKWQKAADAAKAVIDLNKYSLFNDYKTLFLAANLYNPEIIWTRPFSNSLDRETYVELGLYPNGYGGYGQVHPLHNLAEDYETKNGKLQKDDPTFNLQKPYDNLDPRFYASILYDGAPFKGRPVETFIPKGLDSNEGVLSPHNATQTGYYQRKFMDETITNPTGKNQGNSPWIFFRYAEIFLNYAEAMYNLGNETEARKYINLVRSRPGVTMPAVTESGNALLEHLQNERRIELVFEEHRWFDVRRWKIAPVTDNEDAKKMNITKDATSNKTYNVVVFQQRAFFDRNYLAPIPQKEIEKNSKLAQNPGYN